MADNLFEITDLKFSYGRCEVIKGLSMAVKSGAVTTIIGANGCGKSTLFNLMTKNLKKYEGKILLNNTDISQIRLKDFAKQVAIVHQYNTAPADITVEKLVSYGRAPYHTIGISKNPEEDESKVQWALEITALSDIKNAPVSQLSGGQKQRVWIALALSQDTKILFLDEPTTYLDIRYQLDILRLIKKLNTEYGITVIMVLHDINQSLYYSDEIIAMKDGKAIASGNPSEIITSRLIKEVYDVSLKINTIDNKPIVAVV